MAVLVEAIAVLVRRDRIHESCPGGREGYVGDAPNRTLCADRLIALVEFRPIGPSQPAAKIATRRPSEIDASLAPSVSIALRPRKRGWHAAVTAR